MTEEQIIDGLRGCADERYCETCPFADQKEFCMYALHQESLDLINRQKAEITKLTEDNNFHFRLEALLAEQRDGRDETIQQLDSQNDELRIRLITAKAEAIKEFAERFENKIKGVRFTLGQTFEIKYALKTAKEEMEV